MSKGKTVAPFEVFGQQVAPGHRRELDLPVAELPTHLMIKIPIIVVHGLRPGPRLWVSGAVHGDEVNGVRVVRDVVSRVNPQKLNGTLVAVPVVNVFGFIHKSRYLPDRRDLNRCFPGSPKGSLASRLAHIFMSEVVSRCTHGIDVHTGSNMRCNFPHVRADLKNAEAARLAYAFGAPLILDSDERPGSLREAAANRGICNILYESGEANRFDDDSIELGVKGVLRCMGAIGMIGPKKAAKISAKRRSLVSTGSTWIRAKTGGLFLAQVRLGSPVRKGQPVACITDIYGSAQADLRSPCNGVVIGMSQSPQVYQGDAVIHVAEIRKRA